MPGKVPIERVGTIRLGEIYLKATRDVSAGDSYDAVHQGLNFITVAKCHVSEGEYEWFRIVRAFERRGGSAING